MYPKEYISNKKNSKEKGTCFVIMPFKEDMIDIYQLIKKIVEEKGYKCFRTDEIFSPTPIMKQILDSILRAEVIIADLTGKNPNVFYELGISHTIKENENIITIAQSLEDIPFDIRHFKHIIYNNSQRGAEDLRLKLQKYLKEILSDIKKEKYYSRNVTSIELVFEGESNLIYGGIGEGTNEHTVEDDAEKISCGIIEKICAKLAYYIDIDKLNFDDRSLNVNFPDGYITSTTEVTSGSIIGSMTYKALVTLKLNVDERYKEIIKSFFTDRFYPSKVGIIFTDKLDMKNLQKLIVSKGLEIISLSKNKITFKLEDEYFFTIQKEGTEFKIQFSGRYNWDMEKFIKKIKFENWENFIKTFELSKLLDLET